MKKDLNSLTISVLSSNSISILPSKPCFIELEPQSLNSSELSRYLLEEILSPVHGSNFHSNGKDKLFYFDNTPRETIREFDDVDENAPTLMTEHNLMCSNCYECILLEDIDNHSINCCTPIENSSAINEKIFKLLLFIREEKNDSDYKCLLPLIKLEEIAKGIYENTIVIYR